MNRSLAVLFVLGLLAWSQVASAQPAPADRDDVRAAPDPRRGADGPPRDMPPRDGPPRDGAPRDGAPRDGAPRDGGGRDVPPRDGPGRDVRPPDGAGRNPDNPPPPRVGGPPMMQIEMLRGYMDVVDRYTRLARDPVASAIAAIVTAKDIHKQRGNDAAIAFLTKALSEAKNDAVQRAIRFQLVEVYREAGQQDKAVEMLSALINVPADK